MITIYTHLLRVRLRDTAPLPTWVSRGPVQHTLTPHAYTHTHMHTHTHTFQSNFVPLHRMNNLLRDSDTTIWSSNRSNTYTLPSHWHLRTYNITTKLEERYYRPTCAAWKISITACEISGPIPSPLMRVTVLFCECMYTTIIIHANLMLTSLLEFVAEYLAPGRDDPVNRKRRLASMTDDWAIPI